MATATVAARRAGGLGLVSFPIYLVLMASILFFYLRALFQLLPFRERLMGATQILSAPTLSLQGLVIVLLLLVVGLVLYKPLSRWVQLIPVGVRGLLIPLPLYFILTRNLVISALLAVLVAVVWLLYGRLAQRASGLLRPLPSVVAVPLGRFWPAMIYAVIFAGSILPALSAVAVIWGYHYLDNAVEWLFQPVWDWHRALRSAPWMSLFAVRLILGITAPFVFSYSMAWWNVGFERTTIYNAVLVSLITYFIMRMPRGAAEGQAGG